MSGFCSTPLKVGLRIFGYPTIRFRIDSWGHDSIFFRFFPEILYFTVAISANRMRHVKPFLTRAGFTVKSKVFPNV